MTSGSGLQDIDDVFAESNTYQPKVPSHDEEIVVRTDMATPIWTIILIESPDWGGQVCKCLNTYYKQYNTSMKLMCEFHRSFKNHTKVKNDLLVNSLLIIPLVEMLNSLWKCFKQITVQLS